jgi:ribosome assembly protein YihI (activator of Der GTPase)
MAETKRWKQRSGSGSHAVAAREVYEIEEKSKREQARREHDAWKAHHELAMKEFDDKLNGLVAWLDDFVKRNPKNGK